jgi:hypothetical protein
MADIFQALRMAQVRCKPRIRPLDERSVATLAI